MTYRIIYSPESLDDLRAIYSYIAFDNNKGTVSIVRIFTADAM